MVNACQLQNFAKLLDETIGTEWRKDATKLETLKAFRHDAIVREKLDKIKIDNKKRLSVYLQEKQGITVNENSILISNQTYARI